MIRKGTTVRLKRGSGVARAVERLSDIKGGVLLDRPLRGFRYWNVADLKRAAVSANDAREDRK